MATATAVKERPILFKGEMVQAILEGRKTQTRRIFKVPKDMEWYDGPGGLGGEKEGYLCDDGSDGWEYQWWGHVSELSCPYGDPGERLWVRETWQQVPFGPLRDWPGVPDTRPRKVCESNRACVAIYRADGEMPGDEVWRPSIFMPRWASRITLEITGVRVERLNEISEADAKAEGVGPGYVPNSLGSTTCVGHRPMYAKLWNQINGPGSWGLNPWVWVIEFKRGA